MNTRSVLSLVSVMRFMRVGFVVKIFGFVVKVYQKLLRMCSFLSGVIVTTVVTVSMVSA